MTFVPGTDGPQRWRWISWLGPLLAGVAICGLWAGIAFKVHSEEARAEDIAKKEMSAYSEAYAQYLTRSIGQLDQITMQLKQSWEQSRGGIRLDALKRAGLFTDPAFVGVGIVGTDGTVLSAIGRGIGVAAANRSDFFLFHKNNISTALRIGVPDADTGVRQSSVLFSRRLDGADDEFRGAVVVVIDASFFTAYYGARSLGQLGMVAMVNAGALRLERAGPAVSTAAGRSLFSELGYLWSSTMDDSVLLIPAAGFADRRARVVGWHASPAYPVLAIAAVAQEEVMAAPESYWRSLRNQGIAVTLLLLSLATCAVLLSRRTLARQHADDEVRLAYRAATESANEGFYMIAALRDRDGNVQDFEVVDCNERGAYFYGLTRQQLVGMRISVLTDLPFGRELMATYRDAMLTGYHEDERQMPDDSRIRIGWAKRRIVRVGNGLAITLQDLSERKAHEYVTEGNSQSSPYP